MRLFRFLLSALLLLPAPALALSCVPWNEVLAFQAADRAKSGYVVVHGRLRFDPGELPIPDAEASGTIQQTYWLPAGVSGLALTRGGFNSTFNANITLEVGCIASWCGPVSPGEDELLFLEQTDEGYVLVVDPCPVWIIPRPDARMLENVVSCVQGGRCDPADSR